MSDKLVRWKFYFDKDEEELWLNKMAAEGLSMKSFFMGRYVFEKTEPGKYIYRVDLCDNEKGKDYLTFLQEEMGVELVQRWGFWMILRKPASEGEFELYTDRESLSRHYGRIANMFFIVAALEFAMMIFEMVGVMHGAEVLWLFVIILGALGILLLRAGLRSRIKQKNLR